MNLGLYLQTSIIAFSGISALITIVKVTEISIFTRRNQLSIAYMCSVEQETKHANTEKEPYLI